MLAKIGLLALVGAVGTLARYAVGGLVQRLAGETFPWGTFVVNAYRHNQAKPTTE